MTINLTLFTIYNMKRVLLLLLSSLLCSCGHFSKKTLGNFDWKHVVDKDIAYMSVDKSDINNVKVIDCNGDYCATFEGIVDSIVALPLETTNESIIGSISKLQLTDSLFFISDLYQTKLIKVFNRKGKYLYNIGSVGNGPFEYIEPTDFVVFENQVYIIDQYQNKLLTYNHVGKGIKEYKLPFFCMQIAVINENCFLFRGANSDNYHIKELLNYSLWICDTLMQVKKHGCYMPHNTYLNLLRNSLKQCNGKIYFNDIANDSIFSINSKGNMKCEVVFDFDKRRNKVFFKSNKKYIENINSGNICDISDYLFCDSLLYYSITTNKKAYRAFYSMRSNRTIWFNCFDIENDKLTKVHEIVSSTPLAFEKGYLIYSTMPASIIRPYDHFGGSRGLCDISKKTEYKYVKEEISLLENLSEEDNPILIFYKLKQW